MRGRGCPDREPSFACIGRRPLGKRGRPDLYVPGTQAEPLPKEGIVVMCGSDGAFQPPVEAACKVPQCPPIKAQPGMVVQYTMLDSDLNSIRQRLDPAYSAPDLAQCSTPAGCARHVSARLSCQAGYKATISTYSQQAGVTAGLLPPLVVSCMTALGLTSHGWGARDSSLAFVVAPPIFSEFEISCQVSTAQVSRETFNLWIYVKHSARAKSPHELLCLLHAEC